MRWAITCAFFVGVLFVTDSQARAAKELRIISLAPSTTEILFALGLDREIIGVSTFCNYPQAVETKERVGSLNDLSLEKITFLKPDLIFCAGLVQMPSVGRLKAAGYRVYVSDPHTVEELFTSITEIGKLVGRDGAAAALVAAMRADLALIDAAVSARRTARPTVYVEIWHDPIYTIGGACLLDDMIGRAGGITMLHDQPVRYLTIGPEVVIGRNPDCIIVGYMSRGDAAGRVRGRYGWDRIAAVRTGHIFTDLDPDIILRPSPRTVEGIRMIAERIGTL